MSSSSRHSHCSIELHSYPPPSLQTLSVWMEILLQQGIGGLLYNSWHQSFFFLFTLSFFTLTHSPPYFPKLCNVPHMCLQHSCCPSKDILPLSLLSGLQTLSEKYFHIPHYEMCVESSQTHLFNLTIAMCISCISTGCLFRKPALTETPDFASCDPMALFS